MSTIHIHKDTQIHPLPDPKTGRTRKPTIAYPFLELKPGESFTVRTENRGHVQTYASILSRYDAAGRKYATRHLPDGQTRVTRTA